MAKQFRMTKNGVVVYPQSITDAIADTKRKKTLTAVLDDTDTKVNGITTNVATITSDVSTAKSNITALQNADKTMQSDISTAKSNISKAQNDITALQDADKLASDLKATTTVGKVNTGSTFAEGTDVRDVLKAILAFDTPTFASLVISDSATTYNANTNMFCNSAELRVATISHSETNVDSIKNKQITLNVNGTTSTETASATSVALTKSAIFNRSTNKAKFTVSLNGTNTLGAAMAGRSVTLTAYMPVYTFVSDTQDASAIKTALASATAKPTVYTGAHTIDETQTFKAGGCWCVALPSHMGMSGIGTVADFGFGTQKTTTTTVTGTRTVNGIANVSYTVYLLPMGTAQTNLAVRITTKAI